MGRARPRDVRRRAFTLSEGADDVRSVQTSGRRIDTDHHESREEIEPLTGTLRRLHVTVTKQWIAKLEAAKDALSHSIPSGSAEAVLEAALDALLEREAKRKGLLVKSPRPPRPGVAPRITETTDPSMEQDPVPAAAEATRSPKRRRKPVPAHVRREVLKRDGGKCQARLHDGTICGSTVRLQLDHVVPESLGGPATIENIRILCARHNQVAARKVFGEQVMDLFARPRG